MGSGIFTPPYGLLPVVVDPVLSAAYPIHMERPAVDMTMAGTSKRAVGYGPAALACMRRYSYSEWCDGRRLAP
ncbi:MAG: hypothetical protein IMX01_06390 [Limnochordaceae bacterium]|nr:hypothetical protein [Limnochordaceae bacterium]